MTTLGPAPPTASRAERHEAGRAVRDVVPIEAHATVPDPAKRPDPVAILRSQDANRLPELVPIRYGRMSATPFTFLRGAAAVMAADLTVVSPTGLNVQLCGDAHLANFGVFSAPDRRLVVDVNDFDETLPGSFEWDVKRLAASLVVAARANGFDRETGVDVVVVAVEAYRKAMSVAAAMDPLDLWYLRVELDDLPAIVQDVNRDRVETRLQAASDKAHRKDRRRAARKLTEVVDGRRRIVHDPPLTYRPPPERVAAELEQIIEFLRACRDSLSRDRLQVLDRYRVTDLAHRVVGVGSVGTRCWLLLAESGDGETLFLQFKQATQSVLEPYLGASELETSGQRVVEGQRMIQAASDVFLGWARYESPAGPIDYYFRQFWDGKWSPELEGIGRKRLRRYGRLCGLVLARAHARSGDAAAISGYLGDDDAFARTMAAFADAYSALNDADHERLVSAVRDGNVEARTVL